uniref:C-type lectin domain-containing protein n=1 Tax=Ciona savignyi TaxID=51511 RepID=H2ZFP9_CIOSA
MVNDSAWRGEYPILRTIGVWIGLKLNMNETQALWSDKTLLNETIFTNWAQQPDTDHGRCVQLWPQFYWQWDDTYCDLKKFYICEDKDPANYTKTDLDNLSSSIIKLTMEPNTNTETMTKLSNKLNNLLDISEATFSETISAQKVLVAVDQVTRNYNLTTEGSFYLNLSNIAITITSEVNSTNGLTLGDEMHTMSSSSIFLSNDLIQEASNKGDTQLQISSVIYRKTTLFDVTNPTSTNSTIQ